jgi:hypothetical protein
MYNRRKRLKFIIKRLRNYESNIKNIINNRLKIKIRISFRKLNLNSVIII